MTREEMVRDAAAPVFADLKADVARVAGGMRAVVVADWRRRMVDRRLRLVGDDGEG